MWLVPAPQSVISFMQWFFENGEIWKWTQQGFAAAFVKNESLYRQISTNYKPSKFFWRILEDNKQNKREKVGTQYKSLCAIHQAGYVCQTYSSNKMNSLPLSFLPSRPCLFWWILSTNSCLLVFNSIFQSKTTKWSVFWK